MYRFYPYSDFCVHLHTHGSTQMSMPMKAAHMIALLKISIQTQMRWPSVAQIIKINLHSGKFLCVDKSNGSRSNTEGFFKGPLSFDEAKRYGKSDDFFPTSKCFDYDIQQYLSWLNQHSLLYLELMLVVYVSSACSRWSSEPAGAVVLKEATRSNLSAECADQKHRWKL